MSGAHTLQISKFLLCGSATAYLVACGVEPNDTQAPDRAPSVGAAGSCTDATAGGTWTRQAFGAQSAQSGAFSVDLTATPSANAIDAVVGISNGPAAAFTSLAAIVRFNPSGAIDVRAGSAYQADLSVPYTAGTAYHLHVDIDVGQHIYSVAIVHADGSETWLAQRYPFRTEQAQTTALSNVATKVDASEGALSVCDLKVTPSATASCPAAAAGAGFRDQSIGQPGEGVVSMDFVATPDSILDGVMGLSPGPATSFGDLAAAVRLSPEGAIDARNGAAYQADAAVPYLAGQPTRIRVIADVPTQTYAVYVAQGDGSVQLAHHYGFRSPGTAHWLGDLSSFVDSSSGRLSICDLRSAISIGVRSSREGNYAVAPLPDDEAMIANTTTTLHVDRAGNTRAHVAAGGQVAVDPTGNVYLARITGTALVVEAYTAGLVPRWTRSYPAGADHRALAIGADAGSVVVAAGPTAGGVDLVKRWLTDGTESISQTGPMADAVAVSAAGFVLGSAINGTVVVTKWDFGQPGPTWSRSWQNAAQIAVMALSPDGKVYFGGRFSGTVSFGGPDIQASPTTDLRTTYVAALSSTGEHMFSTGIGQSSVDGIASNGSVTAVSASSDVLGPRHRTLFNFDARGNRIVGDNEQTAFGDWGAAGATAVGPSGRVFWNFSEPWPFNSSPAYPYLISLQPGV